MSCKVKVNRHNKLAFRFYWNGREFWQGTDWTDNKKDRIKAEGRAQEITEEIKAGTFNYLKWFPAGNKAHEFKPKPKPIQAPAETITVKQCFESWIEKKKPPFVRRTQERDYRQHFACYVIPFMGDTELNAITFGTLETFRIHLTETHKVSLITARKIIDGSLRAMFRDQRSQVNKNPFDDIPAKWWPRQQKAPPDPFTESERDSILKYYRANRPYKDYAFVFFRFYTGTRPSEAVALKWGNVDLINAKAAIMVSRTLGEENATKTTASTRSVKLLPNVVELLKSILPLHVEADSYVFTDGVGLPLNQNDFGEKFQDVLRVLKIRPRPFYNTRHTYISVALTIGSNPKWISEQTGTGLTMIQENYGKYIRDDGDAFLVAYVQKMAQKEVKTETLTGTSAIKPRILRKSLEPVKESNSVYAKKAAGKNK